VGAGAGGDRDTTPVGALTQTTRVQATTTTPTTSTFPGIRAHAKESGTGAAQRMRPHRADNAVALHPHIRSRGQCVLSSSSPASFQAVASSLRGEDSGGRDGREGRTGAFDESACTHADAHMPPPVVFALTSVDFAHVRASKPVLRWRRRAIAPRPYFRRCGRHMHPPTSTRMRALPIAAFALGRARHDGRGGHGADPGGTCHAGAGVRGSAGGGKRNHDESGWAYIRLTAWSGVRGRRGGNML
jgi:hypothetical protein